MANEILNPFQQFFDDGGRELARGSIEFFENGQTVVQLSIFSDSDLTAAQSNPYELDDYGRIRGNVRYEGLATLVITNAAGLQIRQLDDVVAASAGNTGSITRNYESVAAMISDNSLAAGSVAQTQGFYAGNRYGGALYEIVAGGTGAADSFLFHNLGNGLQAALLNREAHNDFLVAGARGDGGSNDTTAMQSVINQGGNILVRKGFIFAATNLAIALSCRFVGGGTMKQLGASSGDLIQITARTVIEVKFRGVTFDGNQLNGNAGNSAVGWVV